MLKQSIIEYRPKKRNLVWLHKLATFFKLKHGKDIKKYFAKWYKLASNSIIVRIS